MEIIKTSNENLGMKAIYDLTRNPKGKTMTEAIEMVLEIDCWAHYRDTDSKGEEKEIVSIRTKEGDIFRTISQTFIQEFLSIMKMGMEFNNQVNMIKPIGGTTKAGRDFITCEYYEA